MVGMKRMRRISRAFRGFSLVELLVVISIIALLSAMAITAFNSVASSARIQSTGDGVADMLIQARQLALTRNVSVEVRLTRDENGNGRVFQIYGFKGTNVSSIGRRLRLPDGVAICSNLSPLLNDGSNPTNGSNISTIRFQPNGEPLLSSELASAPNQVFLTIGMARDASAAVAPENYIAITINPYTGQVQTYRP